MTVQEWRWAHMSSIACAYVGVVVLKSITLDAYMYVIVCVSAFCNITSVCIGFMILATPAYLYTHPPTTTPPHPTRAPMLAASKYSIQNMFTHTLAYIAAAAAAAFFQLHLYCLVQSFMQFLLYLLFLECDIIQ
ncbi:unnamed protein product [Ceratitis capitata]|uniref:(Mediterranean fruit fly) hypothetical protein n=1 Tax=Ceratitis capitata TaxID=7213 RepID=A0A811VBK0_CERCA|nr:unnamed protein product [Ceratitis capitata]